MVSEEDLTAAPHEAAAPMLAARRSTSYDARMSATLDLNRALDVARRAVAAAGEAAMRHFQQGVEVETKGDGSPVTRADREAEAAILRLIRDAFPEHSILTEESGAHDGRPEFRWIIDPLDGTQRFTRGYETWGPLIALEHRSQVVVGAMGLPVRGEAVWAARGLGCFIDGERGHVSSLADWAKATISLGAMGRILASGAGDGAAELVRTAVYGVGGADLAGIVPVLRGQAEAWIEYGVKVWDIAPMKVMVEEAGGRFTDFSGEATIESGCAIATNGRLHSHVLNALRGGGHAG